MPGALSFFQQWLDNRAKGRMAQDQLKAQQESDAAKARFKLGITMADPQNPTPMIQRGLAMAGTAYSVLNSEADVDSFMEAINSLDMRSQKYKTFHKQLSAGIKQVGEGKMNESGFMQYMNDAIGEFSMDTASDRDFVQNTSKSYTEQAKNIEEDRLMQQYMEQKAGRPVPGTVNKLFDPTKVGVISTGENTSPGTTVNINNISGKSFKKLGEEMAKKLVVERDDTQGVALAYQQLQPVKQLLNEGMITGAGADIILSFGKGLQRLGVSAFDDPIANTEAYASQMGSQVGRIIKQFGAGTGLSDADREYAEKIAGGKITLSAPALKKIIAMNEKAMKNVIKNYNKKAKQVMSKDEAAELPYNLMIEGFDDGDGAQQEEKPKEKIKLLKIRKK